MKLPHRRRFLHLAAGAAALPAVSRIARAQAYPTRPITMIVPFPAGGPGDTLGRFMSERVRASLGQPVIIENVSGAAGSLGVGRVARAAPDGYTLGIGGWSTHVVNAVIYALQYDVLNDFEPIALLTNNSSLIVAKKTMPAHEAAKPPIILGFVAPSGPGTKHRKFLSCSILRHRVVTALSRQARPPPSEAVRGGGVWAELSF
jgi:hypothetical protein